MTRSLGGPGLNEAVGAGAGSLGSIGAYLGAVVVVVLAYGARAWTCAVALNAEPLAPDVHVHRVDAHGYGIMGAFLSVLVFALPVGWLLLQRRAVASTARGRAFRLRAAAVLLVIGTPMLVQWGYLRMPLRYGWPVAASCVVWFGIVAALCCNIGRRWPSAQASFERFPVAAWSIVGLIAAAKLAVPVLVLVGY